MRARVRAHLVGQTLYAFSRLSGDLFAKASDKLPSAVENSKAVMAESALAMGVMVFLARDEIIL